MILAEKFSQKLNNLKSKNEIKDFFVFFDEFRSLSLHQADGAISKLTDPTHYSEFSIGTYLIVWNNEKVSKGIVTNTSISGFDEFINNARKTAGEVKGEIFIPERGIYPMVRVYSKSLADMIDVPEYILKLADILDELDRMVKNTKGEADLEIREGTRYAYSSRNLDEYYPYTDIKLQKVFTDKFAWSIQSADIFSISKFQELFSFLGDTYNLLVTSKPKELKKGEYEIVLPPNLFQNLFNEQIIGNINGDKVLQGKSVFKKDEFLTKAKVLGTLSMSYDPLLNLKRGTYRFTSFGFKPQRQYFIKFGKLDTPLLNNLNFSLFDAKSPTMEITDFGNIKLEGLRKKTFEEIKRTSPSFIYIPGYLSMTQKDLSQHKVLCREGISFEGDKTFKIGKATLEIDLIKLIQEGKLELIEFIDGQLGAKIVNLQADFH